MTVNHSYFSLMEVSNRSPEKTGYICKLRCAVKNYNWGRIGSDSRVSRLFSKNSGLSVEDDEPYAEFWMGTHDSGPAFVVERSTNGSKNDEEETLKSYISRNPSVLGDKVIQKWGNDLPFLFKVLSVAKALSIQAHPNKELAKQLHKQQPNIYKDDNHKPEMALAITEFEALCGFVSIEDLKEVILNVPEIEKVIGSSYKKLILNINNHEDVEEENVRSILRSVFTQLMSATKDAVSAALLEMRSRLNQSNKDGQLTEKEKLILKLEKQYPEDVGIIAAFLLNHVQLKPGEALYLGANEPHAYLSGECIECMATSDNVVRAGLTPKTRDIQVLCSMLTYNQGFPKILEGIEVNPYTKKYLPPFDEFEVDHCTLPIETSMVFPIVDGPSIFVVTEGEGMFCGASFEEMVMEGDVLFAGAGTEVSIATKSSHINLYRAGVSSSFFNLTLILVSCESLTTDGIAAIVSNCRYMISQAPQLDKIESFSVLMQAPQLGFGRKVIQLHESVELDKSGKRRKAKAVLIKALFIVVILKLVCVHVQYKLLILFWLNTLEFGKRGG
ncbi:mannose-6-phosphate isomerase 2-like [Impatiens glandulifera]|uniref:mannose-6-phosphate isomerase 2-like n=1 Tax=Impatiens glandulifera TaxID=253017 RepID=UPI001FB064A6|nr:mannose-6-phosphate isomerase 2-like [Impatiens glandulifera]